MAYSKSDYFEDDFVMNHFERLREDFATTVDILEDPDKQIVSPANSYNPKSVPFSYATKGTIIKKNQDTVKTNLGKTG